MSRNPLSQINNGGSGSVGSSNGLAVKPASGLAHAMQDNSECVLQCRVCMTQHTAGSLGTGDWHLHSLLTQLQATIESNPSDTIVKPPDLYGMYICDGPLETALFQTYCMLSHHVHVVYSAQS